MALTIQHKRNFSEGEGYPVVVENISYRWGYWHVYCFGEAYCKEQGLDPNPPDSEWDSKTNPGSALLFGAPFEKYTYTQDHTFRDPSDGEIMTIKKGDFILVY